MDVVASSLISAGVRTLGTKIMSSTWPTYGPSMSVLGSHGVHPTVFVLYVLA